MPSDADPVHRPELDAQGLTMEVTDKVTNPGEERIERNGDVVDIYMTAKRSHFIPDVIRLKQGEEVRLHVTNVETARDATHGLAIPGYNKQVSLDPGEVVTIEFVADRERKERFDPSLKIGGRVSAAALQEGLIARAMPHGDILGFSPPLVITPAEVDDMIARARRGLDKVTDELVREGQWKAA